MIIEINEVLVNKDELKKIKMGDCTAKEKLRRELDQMSLYVHNIIPYPDDMICTVKELEDLGVIDSVKINQWELP